MVNTMRLKRKLVCGVGLNDADYEVQRKIKNENGEIQRFICPFYEKWKSMIDRCYKNHLRGKNVTYFDCTVCDEWLTFSNFKRWMESQDWKGKQIDKDILKPGNRVYCPEFCRMVNQLTNLFICDRSKYRGKYMIGVHMNKKLMKYQSSCRNPFIGKIEHLGLFDNEIDAHLAWKKRKHELAQLVACNESCQDIKLAIMSMYA